MRILVIIIASALLAGCASKGPASIKGGECRIFERPEYAVRGKKPYDQDWIDSQVEGGVGGCGWKRPAARPATIDGPADVRQPTPAPAKKRGVIRRIKDRVTGQAPAIAPVPYLAPPVPAIQPPAPPPPPRDRVDELLRPSEPARRVY